MADRSRDAGGAVGEVIGLLDRLATARVLSRRSGKWVSPLVVAFEVLEQLAGPGCRPVGSGDPGGGRGASLTSSVERAAGVDGDRPPAPAPEERALANLQELPGEIVESVVRCWREVGVDVSGLVPSSVSPVRLVWWSRWAMRQLRAHGGVPSDRAVWLLLDRVAHLDRVVATWSSTRTPSSSPRVGLAEDLTEMWCRSCLGAGQREPRSERYSSAGVCRWCGDFHGAHGWWPTVNLLRARHAGKRVDERMIRDEDPRRKRKRKK